MVDSSRPQWRSTAWTIAATVLCVLLLIATVVGVPQTARAALFAAIAAIALAVAWWAVWKTRKQWDEYEDQLTAWAARQAIQAERLRIARELHDVVSHSLGLVTVRCAGARRQVETGNDIDVVAVLADVEQASRNATVELRRMLELLRDQSATTASTQPVKGIADIAEAVNQARSVGLHVDVSLGELGPVSQGVGLAVYQIIHEALANVIRHAGPTHVRVRVQRTGDLIAVEVLDQGPTGPWTAQPGAGHGLMGLRERVQNLSGTFIAERQGSGFVVSAQIPDRQHP